MWLSGDRGPGICKTKVFILRPGIFQVPSNLPLPPYPVTAGLQELRSDWAQAQAQAQGHFPVSHVLGRPGAEDFPPQPLSPISDNDPGVQKDLLLTINNILLPNNYKSSCAI